MQRFALEDNECPFKAKWWHGTSTTPKFQTFNRVIDIKHIVVTENEPF